MKAFAITFRGEYLRPARSSWSGGTGPTWSPTIAGAKLYSSEDELDKRLLEVARSCPIGGPWPEVCELEVTVVQKISHASRFEKNRARALKAAETFRANWDKRRQAEAQHEVARLEEQLRCTKARAGA